MVNGLRPKFFLRFVLSVECMTSFTNHGSSFCECVGDSTPIRGNFVYVLTVFSGCPAPHSPQNLATLGITAPQFLQVFTSSPEGGTFPHLEQMFC